MERGERKGRGRTRKRGPDILLQEKEELSDLWVKKKRRKSPPNRAIRKGNIRLR